MFSREQDINQANWRTFIHEMVEVSRLWIQVDKRMEFSMTPTDYQSRILARVDAFIAETTRFIESKKDDVHYKKAIGDWKAAVMLFRALRVAVEMHGADPTWSKVCKTCRRANIDQLACRVDFPCPELKAIGKEMGIDE